MNAKYTRRGDTESRHDLEAEINITIAERNALTITYKSAQRDLDLKMRALRARLNRLPPDPVVPMSPFK